MLILVPAPLPTVVPLPPRRPAPLVPHLPAQRGAGAPSWSWPVAAGRDGPASGAGVRKRGRCEPSARRGTSYGRWCPRPSSSSKRGSRALDTPKASGRCSASRCDGRGERTGPIAPGDGRLPPFRRVRRGRPLARERCGPSCRCAGRAARGASRLRRLAYWAIDRWPGDEGAATNAILGVRRRRNRPDGSGHRGHRVRIRPRRGHWPEPRGGARVAGVRWWSGGRRSCGRRTRGNGLRTGRRPAGRDRARLALRQCVAALRAE